MRINPKDKTNHIIGIFCGFPVTAVETYIDMEMSDNEKPAGEEGVGLNFVAHYLNLDLQPHSEFVVSRTIGDIEAGMRRAVQLKASENACKEALRRLAPKTKASRPAEKGRPEGISKGPGNVNRKAKVKSFADAEKDLWAKHRVKRRKLAKNAKIKQDELKRQKHKRTSNEETLNARTLKGINVPEEYLADTLAYRLLTTLAEENRRRSLEQDQPPPHAEIVHPDTFLAGNLGSGSRTVQIVDDLCEGDIGLTRDVLIRAKDIAQDRYDKHVHIMRAAAEWRKRCREAALGMLPEDYTVTVKIGKNTYTVTRGKGAGPVNLKDTLIARIDNKEDIMRVETAAAEFGGNLPFEIKKEGRESLLEIGQDGRIEKMGVIGTGERHTHYESDFRGETLLEYLRDMLGVAQEGRPTHVDIVGKDGEITGSRTIYMDGDYFVVAEVDIATGERTGEVGRISIDSMFDKITKEIAATANKPLVFVFDKENKSIADFKDKLVERKDIVVITLDKDDVPAGDNLTERIESMLDMKPAKIAFLGDIATLGNVVGDIANEKSKPESLLAGYVLTDDGDPTASVLNLLRHIMLRETSVIGVGDGFKELKEELAGIGVSILIIKALSGNLTEIFRALRATIISL